MQRIILTFPDEGTAQQFDRWRVLYGKDSCLTFVQGTLDRDEPYLYGQNWAFWWDAIPF